MKLTFNVEQFKPVDGNVLVQPGPIKKIKTLQAKTSGNEYNIDGSAPEVELTYGKDPTVMRLGKVLGISDSVKERAEFEVGDWIVYNSRRGYSSKLDLIAKSSDDEKCPVLMMVHEIVSKVDINE
jgi:hypothetical protein